MWKPGRKNGLVSRREILLKKKSELLCALCLPRTGAQDQRVGEDDQAGVLHEEFVSQQVNHLTYDRIRAIDAALDLMDSGEYGTCAICGEAISAKRLDAVPWAVHCVSCEEGRDWNGNHRAARVPPNVGQRRVPEAA